MFRPDVMRRDGLGEIGDKWVLRTHLSPISLSIFLLALLVLAVLAWGCKGRRKEPEYPYGYTTRVLVDQAAGITNYGTDWQPSISADGRFVAFHAEVAISYQYRRSFSSAYVYDRNTGETVPVSIGKDGEPVDGRPVISADGRHVAFSSNAMNGEGNSSFSNIYVFDLKKKETILVSMAYNEQPADGNSAEPSISADGRYVAFESGASNLVKRDTNQTLDIFVYDLETGEMRRASVASDGTEANGQSIGGAISGSGRYVAFYSQASNLAAGESQETGIFLHDLHTGETISITAGQGIPISQASALAINADGRYVVFLGYHVPSNLANLWDYGLCLYDRQSGKVEFLVKDLNGEPTNSLAYQPSISADGRYLAFVSPAPNLVAGASNGHWSVYVLDRKTGKVQLISASSKNVQGDGISSNPAISADGQHVVFVSEAHNLVEGYPRGAIGVYIHDISNWGKYPIIDARRFSQATPFPGPYPAPTKAPLFSPYPYPGP